MRAALSRSRAATAAIVLPLLLCFAALPLGLLLARSLAAGPEVYFAALQSAQNRSALGNSLLVGAGVAATSLCLGGLLGAMLARLRLRGGALLGTLLVLPLAVPSYVWAMAFIALAAPRAGLLNRLALALGAAAPPFDIYSLGGIVFVESLALFPLVLLPVRAALQAADPALEEAARICGAGPVRAFLTGSLPLALPAAASGALLAFLAAVSSFGVPYLLGIAAARPRLTATTRIYQSLALGAEADVRAALALCALLLCFAAAAFLLAARVQRALPGRAGAGGKGRRLATLQAPALARLATIFAWLVALISVLLPVASVVLSAFTRRFSDPPGPGNLTLAQFQEVLGKREVQGALGHSALLALGAALAVVALGVGLAYLRRGLRAATPWAAAASFLLRLAEAPYAVPGSVLALAFLLAFSQEVRFVLAGRLTLVLALPGTLWLLGVAYAVKYLAFGARAADDALRAVDPALEEAARICGASSSRAFADVALPLARPALLAGFILAFLPAATELTMSVLLVGPRTQVLGTVLFELASYADPPSAAVLACVVLALAAAADVLLRRLAGAAHGVSS